MKRNSRKRRATGMQLSEECSGAAAGWAETRSLPPPTAALVRQAEMPRVALDLTSHWAWLPLW